MLKIQAIFGDFTLAYRWFGLKMTIVVLKLKILKFLGIKPTFYFEKNRINHLNFRASCIWKFQILEPKFWNPPWTYHQWYWDRWYGDWCSLQPWRIPFWRWRRRGISVLRRCYSRRKTQRKCLNLSLKRNQWTSHMTLVKFREIWKLSFLSLNCHFKGR